ncbi:MAG: hypothetical protein QOK40_1537, partial [Miltoncostaeaceae bacterium]|nr:hypothetical protein [Miltoncostaeaceae bacterium]
MVIPLVSAPLRQRRPAEPRERADGPAPRTERADQEEAGRAASGSGLTPGGVLALQRLAGNAAVGTLLARMPTKGQMTSAIGVEPKEDKEFKVGIISYTREMSTRYKEILNALHEYGSFLALTHIPADSGSVEKDGARILAMLDAIIERALVYRQAHKSGQVSDYCATLVSLASRERVLVKEAVAALANDPPVHSPYWISRIPQDPVQTLPPRAPMTVPAPVLGAVAQAGAQKTTEQIQTPAGHTGRWSPDTPSAQLGAHVVEHQAEYGIDMTRTSQSARSVAMSRLDALLAGDVVAPTQFGNRGGVQGMVMAEAVGKQ